MISIVAVLTLKAQFGDAVIQEAKAFLGVPYVANTLDKDVDVEHVVCIESGLDCVTFMEMSLGRARAKVTGRTVEEEVEKTRYINGKNEGYTTRNHYTTGWLLNNSWGKNVQLLLQDVRNAVPSPREINFMSSHADRYPQLAKHPNWVPWIRDIEITFADHDMKMVPKKSLSQVAKHLRPGDILCFATSVPGLDFSHVALVAGVKRGKVEFWHASSTQKKVVADPDLAAYAEKQAKCTGFVFARPLRPAK